MSNKLKTTLKWRKKTKFKYENLNYYRFILICGIVMYVRKPNKKDYFIVPFSEEPSLYKSLEETYKKLSEENDLNSQKVKFK